MRPLKVAKIVKILRMWYTLRAIAARQMVLRGFWDWFSYFQVTPIHPSKSTFISRIWPIIPNIAYNRKG